MSIVHISGRIGRDAEVRTVGDSEVANFSVAENIGFGDRKTTQWWSCALWGSRGAKLAPYLTKGSAVTVCGEVSVREYDGKDGSRKWELTCRVMDVALQGSRGDDDSDDARLGRAARQMIEERAKEKPPAGIPTATGLSTGADFEADKDLPF